MAPSKCALDAHEQPSAELRAEWKSISRLTPFALDQDANLDDPRAASPENGFKHADPIKCQQLKAAFSSIDARLADLATADSPVVYHKMLPGLLIAPALVPHDVQGELLDRLLHRDLAEPKHQTNLHLHYDLPYPATTEGDNTSFFNISPEQPGTFRPKDPEVHKPLSARRVFDKRLHWVTLGGQYDWTNRVYPETEPPPFPEDIRDFLEALYPETRAQAAIVNLYSPGDTMMMHRDVSEETDRGLISLSIGCDGLFMITREDIAKTAGTRDEKDKGYLLLRLRSGDVIYMTEEARFAWHGVPKVIAGTCPLALKDWPAIEGRYEEWKGWLEGKRLNLNVRQMKDTHE